MGAAKIESPRLSEFWGQPRCCSPTGWTSTPRCTNRATSAWRRPSVFRPWRNRLPRAPRGSARGRKRLRFAWRSPGFPRMIGVTFQHPTPYFDDSYAVNSANNGPPGRPHDRTDPSSRGAVRMVPEGWARLLTEVRPGDTRRSRAHRPTDFGGAPTRGDEAAFLWNIYEDDRSTLTGWSEAQDRTHRVPVGRSTPPASDRLRRCSAAGAGQPGSLGGRAGGRGRLSIFGPAPSTTRSHVTAGKRVTCLLPEANWTRSAPTAWEAHTLRGHGPTTSHTVALVDKDHIPNARRGDDHPA